MLRVRARLEPLDRRRLLTIESTTSAASIDADGDLVLQAVSGGAGNDTPTVIAYSDRDAGTGKGKDIFVRRFRSDGTPLASGAIVNSTTSGAQMSPDVAVNDDGRFVVVWQSENQDGSGWGIYARLFNADATAATGEILVNQTTNGSQVAPKVDIGQQGFVVSWTDESTNGGNGAILAREFDAAGSPVAGELVIANASAKGYGVSDIRLVSGGFAVAWVVVNLDTDNNTDIQTRAYDTNDDQLLSIKTVNTGLVGDQAEPVISPGTGVGPDYFVAFSDASTAEAGILFRGVDVSSAVDYVVLQANQDSIGHRSRPRIDTDGVGNLVIGWTQQEAETTYSSTVYRSFDLLGVATSNELAVTDGTSVRSLMDVVMTQQGRFVEISTIGEFIGYGLGTQRTLESVLLFEGTTGNDNLVVYDLDDQTLRTSFNGVTQNFRKSAYARVRVDFGDGNDVLFGSDASLMFTVSGGGGNDSIFTGSGFDSISGGDGNDSITLGDGSDYAIGNSGNDTIFGNAGDDTLTGSGGKDLLYGGEGADRVAGTGSPDQIFGEGGDDRLYGDDGDDRLDGGGGRDRVYGGENNDSLVGGSSNDRLYGQNGNDTLAGGRGNDYLAGDAGTDTVLGKEPGDTLFEVEIM